MYHKNDNTAVLKLLVQDLTVRDAEINVIVSIILMVNHVCAKINVRVRVESIFYVPVFNSRASCTYGTYLFYNVLVFIEIS